MNPITYKRAYFIHEPGNWRYTENGTPDTVRHKSMDELRQMVTESINSCQNEGQLASVLKLHAGYFEAIGYFKDIRHEEVTEKMIIAYFKQKNKKQ